MNSLEYIILALGFAVAFYEVRLKDAYKASRQEIWTIPAEMNMLFRGKDGYYSETKGIVIDSIVAGAGLAFAFFAPWDHVPLAVGLVFAGMGGAIHLMQAKDWKRFKANLAKQKALLELLRSDPEGNHVTNPKPIGFGKTIQWIFGTFYDFHVPMEAEFVSGEIWSPEMFADQRRAKEIITSRLIALSKLPESEWFKTDRSKRL